MVLTTPKGVIKIQLARETPLTAANFKKLIQEKFYDGLTFHRVEPGFVIQTGDPTATGAGGSQEKIQLEIPCQDGTTVTGKVAPTGCKPLLLHTKGAVGMARTPDPNSASSQFYITLNVTSSLDGAYAVFGYVMEGLEVAEKIQKGDTITSLTLE